MRGRSSRRAPSRPLIRESLCAWITDVDARVPLTWRRSIART